MLSYYTANAILSHLSGKTQSIGISSSCYVALSKTEPKQDGTNVTEPDSANGYKRTLLGVASQSATQKMDEPLDGTIKSKDIIYFPEATADWGTCSYYALFNAQTGGKLIAYGALSSAISPQAGTVPLIRAEELQMSIS